MNNVNLADFDLDLFLIGKKLVIDSDGLQLFALACERLSKQRTSAFLTAPPGTGVENFLERYRAANPECVFLVDCFRSQGIFGELMLQIGFGHRQINWFDTPVENIVEGLTYFLHKVNNRTVFVFDHCDHLKLPRLAELLSMCAMFNGHAASIFRVTPSYAEKIEKCSDATLRHHVAPLGKLNIDYPTETDLIKACHKNGIISAAVVSTLVQNTLDFDTVASRVQMLRSQVKSYLDKK